MNLSLVMAALNEAPNLEHVVGEALRVFDDRGLMCEVIVVDDGSTDDTSAVLERLRETDRRVRSIRLRRNVGKSAALRLGIRAATGDVVALMDADGQDDPHAIPNLLAGLDAGFDLLTGRRSQRQDRFVKRHTSRLYNRATSAISGVPGSDFNSGLKVMRADVAHSLRLYGELHRYIPVLAHWLGFRTGEMDVSHRPRLHGTSKFGRARFWRGLLDLLTVKFITAYQLRPLHLFGGLGLVFGLAGGGLLAWMLTLKLMGQGVGQRPALLAGILLAVLSAQLFSVGLLAELVVHLREPVDEAAFVVEQHTLPREPFGGGDGRQSSPSAAASSPANRSIE